MIAAGRRVPGEFLFDDGWCDTGCAPVR